METLIWGSDQISWTVIKSNSVVVFATASLNTLESNLQVLRECGCHRHTSLFAETFGDDFPNSYFTNSVPAIIAFYSNNQTVVAENSCHSWQRVKARRRTKSRFRVRIFGGDVERHNFQYHDFLEQRGWASQREKMRKIKMKICRRRTMTKYRLQKQNRRTN